MRDQSTTQRNIQTICDMEQEALNSRSHADRVGDAIATHAGKLWFITVHALFYGFWMLANTLGPTEDRFDPFPFSMMTLIVALEAIFLSLFILMSQTRSSILAERRNHLELQINLLSEDENTKMLQMLQALCKHHGLSIGRDPEIAAMAERTELHEVLEELRNNLPSDE
ncbi:MAG: putative rane protein [Bryobacterales bacterium]|jgi:uncharacterized membrane protein|nr:putative rane protein [Bryobacterales bacterium]